MKKKRFTRIRKVLEQQPSVVFEAVPEQTVVPYDENLLERSRTQWQFGDWESLVQLNRETLQHHPDRAKLALLAAAGRLQMGLEAEGDKFLRLAKDWGVSKKLLIQILIAGVHNSLGRAAAVGNNQEHAIQHFYNSVLMGAQSSEVRLTLTARAQQQYLQLGLPLVNVKTIEELVFQPNRYNKGISESEVSKINQKKINDEIETIRPYFDEAFYVLNNPDVVKAAIEPIKHFCTIGWKQHRDPNPNFSTIAYLKTNQDVDDKGVNPFWHWVLYGRSEGRPLHQQFIYARPGLFNAPERLGELNESVGIIVTIFNCEKNLYEFLDRLNRFTDMVHRIILIESESTDVRVKELCAGFLSKRANALHIKYSSNEEIVNTINSAFELVSGHVVLIKSDTFVPDGWLNRLMHPILTDPTVATVTPMTNSGQIASVPFMFNGVSLDLGIGDLVDNVARKFCPLKTVAELPSAIGFCMAMSRHWLEIINGFDTAFNCEYKEVDWCQRALQNGGKHLLTGALFVERRGLMSFKVNVIDRIKESSEIITGKYPNYRSAVKSFFKTDPAIGQRLALTLAMIGIEGEIPVFLCHRLGGGAEIWLRDVVEQRLEKKYSSVVIRSGDKEDLVLIEVHTVSGVLKSNVNLNELSEYIGILPKKEIVYSCLVESYDPLGIMDKLVNGMSNADRMRIVFHDYFPLCPSYTLIGSDGTYCGLPDSDKCEFCYSTIKKKSGNFPESIGEWRVSWRLWLEIASQIEVFSEYSKRLILSIWKDLKDKIFIKPHKVLMLPRKVVCSTTDRIVLGVLGKMVYHKGASVLHDIAVAAGDLFDIVLLGEIDPDYYHPKVRVHGRYERNEIEKLAKYYSINCWLIPSICPETFSFTTRECLATGLIVYAFDLGAQAEALKDHPNGKLIPKNACAEDIVKIIYSGDYKAFLTTNQV